MEMTAHQQLTVHVHLAEKSMEQQKSRPDASPSAISASEKEVEILKNKLKGQPE